MPTGTISDYDADGLFGLIDADDGRLVLFNLEGVESPARYQFDVGTRVEFVEQIGSIGPRACALATTSGPSRPLASERRSVVLDLPRGEAGGSLLHSQKVSVKDIPL